MAKELASQLAGLISDLQRQRQDHVNAIAEIDAVFEKYSIRSPERKRRGRPPGKRMDGARVGMKPAGRKGRRRTRGKFAKTGLESVLEFVASKGAKGATSAEINTQWKSEGRGATADTTLSQLTKAKKLKRVKLKGQKGSRYTLA